LKNVKKRQNTPNLSSVTLPFSPRELQTSLGKQSKNGLFSLKSTFIEIALFLVNYEDLQKQAGKKRGHTAKVANWNKKIGKKASIFVKNRIRFIAKT
jgi:hypothetical protein